MVNKILKRILALLCVTAIVLCGSSCSLDINSSEVVKAEGQEVIEASMRAYNNQNSGGYEAVDNLTGKLIERFVYNYDEIGFLCYLSETHSDDGSVYREFNSGYVMFVETDGVGEKLSKSDDRFKIYDNNLNRNSKATDAIFGFIADGITDVDIKDNSDGTKTYVYTYDPEKSGVGVDGGKLESYVITYELDKQELVYSIRQQANGVYDNGENFGYDYTITLIDSKDITIVENPIVASNDENSDNTDVG